MTRVKCSICSNVVWRREIDPLLNERMSAAGISRLLAQSGMHVTPEVILRHKSHYKPPVEPLPYERKRDFAIRIRDAADAQFEQGDLLLGNKDHVPGINAGLKAQAIIDGREKQKARAQTADLAFAIIAMLTGGAPPPRLIEDGRTIDGEATEMEETDSLPSEMEETDGPSY